MLFSSLQRIRKIVHEEGITGLLKRGIEEVERPLISRRFRLKYQTNNRNGLPRIIKTAPQHIKWQSSFSRHQFPTSDSKTEWPETPFDNPIIGVYGGRWDMCKRRWSNIEVYQSIVERFEHGIRWEETTRYRRKLSKHTDDTDTPNNYKQTWDDIERLYHSMKEHGYIPQSVLLENPERNPMVHRSPSERHILGESFPDECRIGIGRNGEIIQFGAAVHRISIAKVLGIKEVPALLVLRHKQWQNLRDKIRNNGLPEDHEHLRYHPDLQDILN